MSTANFHEPSLCRLSTRTPFKCKLTGEASGDIRILFDLNARHPKEEKNGFTSKIPVHRRFATSLRVSRHRRCRGQPMREHQHRDYLYVFSSLLESDWHLHNGDHSQRDNKGDYEFYSSELSSRPCTGDRGLHGDTFYHHDPGDIEYQRCSRPGHYKQRIQ